MTTEQTGNLVYITDKKTAGGLLNFSISLPLGITPKKLRIFRLCFIITM